MSHSDCLSVHEIEPMNVGINKRAAPHRCDDLTRNFYFGTSVLNLNSYYFTYLSYDQIQCYASHVRRLGPVHASTTAIVMLCDGKFRRDAHAIRLCVDNVASCVVFIHRVFVCSSSKRIRLQTTFEHGNPIKNRCSHFAFLSHPICSLSLHVYVACV